MKPVILGLLLAVLAAGCFLWFQRSDSVVVESIPNRPIEFERGTGLPDFLPSQVTTLATEVRISLDATDNTPTESLPEGQPSETTRPASMAATSVPTGESAVFEDLDAPTNPDEEFLRLKASEFAYVEFKGVIGGRPLAVFCTDPVSGASEVAGQGGVFREVELAEVHPDHVVLAYRTSPPLRKPRVDLEVEYKPMDQLEPEEIEARTQRFQELYGNRFQQAAIANRKEHGGGVVRHPTPEERANAERVYRETYGEFFHSLQTGAHEGDNREYPPGAPTLEESVEAYLESYWPQSLGEGNRKE